MVGNTYTLRRGKKNRGIGSRSREHVVRGRAGAKAVTGRPTMLREMDSKDTIPMAEDTYISLRRGKKNRGIGSRSRGHTVRGRAWGKAAAGRPKLEEIE